MSFSFGAGGTRDETVSSLRTAAVPDGLGTGLRDALVASLEEAAAEFGNGDPIRYMVIASGHSGPGAVVTCTVKVEAGAAAEKAAAGG